MTTHPISPPPADAAALAVLRRKLGFRAWHRGTREADLLIGGFADRYLAGFDRDDLGRFQRLLREPDPDIYDWMTGRRPIPAEHRNRVTQLFGTFRLIQASPSQAGASPSQTEASPSQTSAS
jgi:antitoxin CptB